MKSQIPSTKSQTITKIQIPKAGINICEIGNFEICLEFEFWDLEFLPLARPRVLYQ
jgi:hypothetical protein